MTRSEQPATHTFPIWRATKAAWIANPAMILMLLITVAGIGTIWLASTYSVAECKDRLLEEKLLRQQQLVPVTPQTQTPTTTPSTVAWST